MRIIPFTLVAIFLVFAISLFSAEAATLAETSEYVPTVDNRTLYVSALKPFQSCAIIFLHGLLGSSQHWINQYQLWDDKCSTIVYDMYGHGLSTGFLTTSDPKVLVKDIEAVLKWSKAKKYVLVGHNYGGIGVQQYWITSKDPKLTAMVLVDSFARNPNPYREGGDQPIIKLLDSNVYKQKDIIEAIKVLINPAKPSDIPQPGWEVFAGSGLITNIDAANQIILTNHTFLINGYKKPVLIIYGTLDSIANKDNWPEMQKAYVGSKLVPIQGSSHSPFIQFPDQFNIQLQKFLDKLSWT